MKAVPKESVHNTEVKSTLRFSFPLLKEINFKKRNKPLKTIKSPYKKLSS